MSAEYVLEVGLGPHNTYLLVTDAIGTRVWDDALPGQLEAPTIHLLLEHAGWTLYDEPHAHELGWWQKCAPIA
jgi:hypothetical protein